MTRTEILQTAKPVLFNTEMVRAIHNNEKSVTRRPLKPHNAVKAKKCGYEQGSGLWYDDTFNEGDKDTHIKDYSVSCCWIGTKIYIQKYAPYKVGDYLYVRETWGTYSVCEGIIPTIYYKADGNAPDKIKWHPSIHMPKNAARIFLRVTDVRVERLQDITDEDLIREGEVSYIHIDGSFNREATRTSYLGTWNSTVKKFDLAKYGWDANPWVWVVEFERVEVE